MAENWTSYGYHKAFDDDTPTWNYGYYSPDRYAGWIWESNDDDPWPGHELTRQVPSGVAKECEEPRQARVQRVAIADLNATIKFAVERALRTRSICTSRSTGD